MAGLNSATIVVYKPRLADVAEQSKIPGNNITKNLKNVTYAALSHHETEVNHLFEHDEDDEDPKEEDMQSFTSRHSKRSIFSRSRRSISKISNLSNLSVASKSSKSRSKRRRREKSRSERKSEHKSDDIVSKSSKSFSVKTFYRNRRNRNNRSQNPSYHGLISRPMSTTHSKRSKTKSSRIDTSGNWRCDQCNYFPNTAFDPHCYKCGAMSHIHQKPKNKSRKRTVSTTGTTTVSSSPILAPGFNQIHSCNLSQRHIIVHSSGDNTTDQSSSDDDNADESETHSSYSSSDSFTADDKAIIVEDYRSKTSQSHSRLAIGQTMDIDDNMDIALPQKSTKTLIDHEPDEYEEDDDDKSDPDGSDSGAGGEVVTDLQSSHYIVRRFSNSIPPSLSQVMNVFHWNKGKLSPVTPKTEEWNAFQWYLGFKRFILAILYFIVTLEEAFVLKHVKPWLSLPLTMCATYVILILYIGHVRFHVFKYNDWLRSVILIVFYVMNVLIIIAPPMSALLASSKVYDFRDIMDRDMTCNHLMWIFFALSVVSMVFIDVVIVHNDEDINDKYRVETFKLAVVKDEEYVLNNQCSWDTVPRDDWGKIHDKLKKKKQKKSKRVEDGNVYYNTQRKDTKGYFVRIDPNSATNIVHNEDEDSTSFEDEDMNTSESEANMDGDVAPIGNINMKHRDHLHLDNEFDDDRQSTNIIHKNRDAKLRRCCTKPFSVLQWILIFVFFMSLQFCVIFAVCDTNEIETHDVSVPPPPL